VNVVVLDAPTGTGKTLIGETVGRILNTPRLYVCSSKQLQDQFIKDYPDAKVLKGRSNYPTINEADAYHPDDPFGHISAEDCTWSLTKSCRFCPEKKSCPYERAKAEALKSNLAVLNTSYLLTEANGPGRFHGRGLVIADEADTLEASLMGHVSVDIGERRLGHLGWDAPSRITVEHSWVEWLHTAIRDLDVRIKSFPDVFDGVWAAREARATLQLRSKLEAVRDGIPTGNWVYTGRRNGDTTDKRGVSFRPARVDHLGLEYLWGHANKWLLMSGTIISSDEVMSSLGWENGYETVSVPASFPLENRRVHYRPAASMSYRNRSDETWDKMVDRIAEDLKRHPDDRVLVHTVSYAFTEYVYQKLIKRTSRSVFRYTSARGKDAALRDYLDFPSSILLAPSMDRGVDLPGEACRVQMITKVPFPNVKDRQIQKRMYGSGGRTWYAVQTVRTLVQMCGRAIRSKDDWAVTYVYDQDFGSNLWARNRYLFPKWFQEAIVWR
jgi:ATP-dependent DNA helicase DinG